MSVLQQFLSKSHSPFTGAGGTGASLTSHVFKPRIPNRSLIHGYASFAERDYTLRDWIKIVLIGGFFHLTTLFLRIGGRPLKEGIISSFSWFFYRVLRDKRKIALINLDLVYGDSISEARKQEITRGMFRHFMRMILDLIFSELYWPDHKLLRYVGNVSSEPVDRTIAEGRGFALISGHVGNLEMMQHVATARGYPMVTVYKGFRGSWFDLFIGRKRLARGNGLIEIPSSRHKIINGKRTKVEQRGIRRLVEEVWDNGGGIAFASDQYARRSRVQMPFLGIPDCPMQVGLMRYVVKNRIPFTLHALVYDPQGNPRWICSDPVFVESQGTHDQTLRHYMTIMNEWLEARIHEYPEQFYWGHRRFGRSYYERPRKVLNTDERDTAAVQVEAERPSR